MFKKGRVAAIIVIALILSVTTYAFAAANTVPDTAAGDGVGAISGYAISGVTYTLDSTYTNITKVSFTAIPTTPPTGTVFFSIKLINGANTWFTCAAGSSSNSWDCTVTGTTVKQADELRVVAHN